MDDEIKRKILEALKASGKVPDDVELDDIEIHSGNKEDFKEYLKENNLSENDCEIINGKDLLENFSKLSNKIKNKKELLNLLPPNPKDIINKPKEFHTKLIKFLDTEKERTSKKLNKDKKRLQQRGNDVTKTFSKSIDELIDAKKISKEDISNIISVINLDISPTIIKQLVEQDVAVPIQVLAYCITAANHNMDVVQAYAEDAGKLSALCLDIIKVLAEEICELKSNYSLIAKTCNIPVNISDQILADAEDILNSNSNNESEDTNESKTN